MTNSTDEEQQEAIGTEASESQVDSSQGVPLPMPTDQEGQGEERTGQSRTGSRRGRRRVVGGISIVMSLHRTRNSANCHFC